jgi:hypothetical protein
MFEDFKNFIQAPRSRSDVGQAAKLDTFHTEVVALEDRVAALEAAAVPSVSAPVLPEIPTVASVTQISFAQPVFTPVESALTV